MDGTATTMRAWRVHEYGEPVDVLRLDTVPVPEPDLPYSPGMETMGTVEACGDGAEDWLGKRVVFTTKPAFGGFAERVICTTAALFEMPEAMAHRRTTGRAIVTVAES